VLHRVFRETASDERLIPANRWWLDRYSVDEIRELAGGLE
jgi:hypothetical protein